MSGKRANIFEAGRPEDPYADRDGPADVPQRATAAQLAQRKYVVSFTTSATLSRGSPPMGPRHKAHYSSLTNAYSFSSLGSRLPNRAALLEPLL